MQHYPKWIYHRTEPAVIVQDADEHAAYSAAWQEAPIAAEASPQFDIPSNLSDEMTESSQPKKSKRSKLAKPADANTKIEAK